MQKFKIPLAVAGVLLLVIAAYFLFSGSSNVYKAIPKSTVAVIEIKDWTKFADKLNSTFSGTALKKTDALQKLSTELSVMRDLLGADKSLKEAVTSGKTVASVHLISADDYDFLFTTELKGVNDNAILNRVQFSPNMRSVKVRIFKNQKIVDVVLKDGKQLSFAKLNDILAFSFSTFLTENSMTAMLTGDNLSNDKSFKSVCAKFTGSSDVALYFNFQKADVILPVVFKPERISLLSDLKNSGTWSRYELSLDNDKMELNGTIANAQETKEVRQEKALEQTLISKIPDNAAYVNATATQNGDTISNQLLKRYFSGWLGDTKAFIILEPLKEDFSEQNVFITTIKNKGRATETLKALIAADGTQPFPMDTFLTNEIYMLKSGSIINQVFGNSLVTFTNSFFCVQNDVAIFCNNADVLKMILEKINKGETLDKDKNYLSASASRFLMNGQLHYFNPQRSDLLLRTILKENSTLSGVLSSCKSALAFSGSSGRETSSHIIFNTTGEKIASSGLLWKTKLQALADFTPRVLANPDGGNEVFVQDTDNNIYLLNQSGGIIFSRNIEEPVLGNVEQLDYYNNGHRQLIFNTTHHVFIIDRMGNDVASYPLRLSATAGCGMTLTTEGGASIYHYYVPCTNGSIYGYEANGKPLAGWSPKSSAGEISQPVQCFNNGKSNYVLTFNSAGKLVLFDSKGNQKWSVTNLPIANQRYSLVKTKGDFVLLNAYRNQLTEISSDGNDNIKPLLDTAYSFAALATSDSSYTYFYSSNNQIRAYDNKGEFLSSSNAADGFVFEIENISRSDKNYLQATDKALGIIYIYDLSLKQVNEIKVAAFAKLSLSDLFNRDEWIELTADDKGNIACYRLR